MSSIRYVGENGVVYWKSIENPKLCHHLDGPAVKYTYEIKSWYLNGKHLTEEEFKKYQLKKRLKDLIK